MRRAQRIRQREDADRDLILAWHVTYVWLKTQHDKRMPPLRQLLGRGSVDRRQGTREQQLMVYQQLSAQFKIPLRMVEKQSA